MPVIVVAIVDAIGSAGAGLLAVLASMGTARVLLWSWRLIRAVWWAKDEHRKHNV